MNSGGMFKKLPTKLIVILMVCCILMIIGVCSLFFFKIINTTFAVILLVLLFISNSLFTNEVTSRVMQKRYDKKMCNPKTYQIDDISKIKDKLISKKAKETNFKFGKSYLIIENNKAYKVSIIENTDLYFNTEHKKTTPNSKLDNCTEFYGFEIFLNISEEIIKKVQLYTFQTEKVYYSGFYSNNKNEIIQANYEEPSEKHKEGYEYLINLLELK